jgi:hypothetical protein
LEAGSREKTLIAGFGHVAELFVAAIRADEGSILDYFDH